MDGKGETWFLEFDPPAFAEGATAAVSIATKIFWALGYNQVESFLTTYDPKKASIDPKASIRRPNGKRTPFVQDDLERRSSSEWRATRTAPTASLRVA